MSINSAYIHIPFCRRRCFYCDFPITVLGDSAGNTYSKWQREYVDFLCQEITATITDNNSPLKTIFFGGGTPSLLALEGLEKILIALESHFSVNNNVEISMEIDPGTFSLSQLKDYKKLGVNRISLGVQSFQDQILKECGRSHLVKDIYQSVNYINQVGINNWSLDLISGLPHQTLTHWQQSLDSAIALNPQHISCYDLVLESSTVFGKKYQSGHNPLPPDDTTAQMYCLASETLSKKGYEHYEISNYAQDNHQCQHNLVYWKNKEYYGFGMGAASHVNQQRFTRPRTRQEYFIYVQNLVENQGKIDHPITTKNEQLLETLMLGLRLKKGINLSEIIQNFGKDTTEKIFASIQPHLKENLIIYSPTENRLKLTDPQGFLYSNSVLTSLFVTLEN